MFTKLKNIKLKKSEKRAIKLGLIVAFLVIVFNLVIYPLYQSYNTLKKQKAKYTKELVQIQKKIKETKKMLKKAKMLKKKYEASKSKLIQSKNIELAQVFLEETISDYAKDRNLNVVRIYKERAKDEKGFKVVKARVTVKGNYGDIIDFLYDIEKDEHYLYAESIIIRYYRGIEAVVSVKGIIQLTKNNKDKQTGGKK